MNLWICVYYVTQTQERTSLMGLELLNRMLFHLMVCIEIKPFTSMNLFEIKYALQLCSWSQSLKTVNFFSDIFLVAYANKPSMLNGVVSHNCSGCSASGAVALVWLKPPRPRIVAPMVSRDISESLPFPF